MRIIGADILVSCGDSVGSVELIDCRVSCNFNLFKDGYVAPKIFEVRGYFDDKSEDFKVAFEHTDMSGCIITGNDT